MVKTSVTLDSGPYYWLRVTSWVAGATIAFNVPLPSAVVQSFLCYQFNKRRAPMKIYLTGTITVEAGTSIDEPYPGPIYG